ncbi:hypothetical protein CYR52_04765 [Chimaeribacter arupi]|nr:hypothetical protein CYR52_04765 [Chimaeribacter arupi]
MVLSSQMRLLRPVSFADTDDLFRIYGDPQTNQFNPAGPYPDIHYARAAIARWLEHWQKHGVGNWAITLQNNPGHIIGFSGLPGRSC